MQRDNRSRAEEAIDELLEAMEHLEQALCLLPLADLHSNSAVADAYRATERARGAIDAQLE